MKVQAIASNGMPLQQWQQMQQIQYEQAQIRNAQMLGHQYPNSETQPPNAVPPPDLALRVINQVDRTAVLLNETTREEARMMSYNLQNRVRETMNMMDSSSAVFDAQQYVEKPKYDAGQYFDKEA